MLKRISLESLNVLKEEQFKKVARTQALIYHKEREGAKAQFYFFQLVPLIVRQLITRMGTKVTWRPWVLHVTDIILRDCE